MKVSASGKLILLQVHVLVHCVHCCTCTVHVHVHFKINLYGHFVHPKSKHSPSSRRYLIHVYIAHAIGQKELYCTCMYTVYADNWRVERAYLVVQLAWAFPMYPTMQFGPRGYPRTTRKRNRPCLFRSPSMRSIQLVCILIVPASAVSVVQHCLHGGAHYTARHLITVIVSLSHTRTINQLKLGKRHAVRDNGVILIDHYYT